MISPFDTLPAELTFHIFSYLKKEPHHLILAGRVCKQWYGLSKESLLWQSVVRNLAPSQSKTNNPYELATRYLSIPFHLEHQVASPSLISLGQTHEAFHANWLEGTVGYFATVYPSTPAILQVNLDNPLERATFQVGCKEGIEQLLVFKSWLLARHTEGHLSVWNKDTRKQLFFDDNHPFNQRIEYLTLLKDELLCVGSKSVCILDEKLIASRTLLRSCLLTDIEGVQVVHDLWLIIGKMTDQQIRNVQLIKDVEGCPDSIFYYLHAFHLSNDGRYFVTVQSLFAKTEIQVYKLSNSDNHIKRIGVITLANGEAIKGEISSVTILNDICLLGTNWGEFLSYTIGDQKTQITMLTDLVKSFNCVSVRILHLQTYQDYVFVTYSSWQVSEFGCHLAVLQHKPEGWQCLNVFKDFHNGNFLPTLVEGKLIGVPAEIIYRSIDNMYETYDSLKIIDLTRRPMGSAQENSVQKILRIACSFYGFLSSALTFMRAGRTAQSESLEKIEDGASDQS